MGGVPRSILIKQEMPGELVGVQRVVWEHGCGWNRPGVRGQGVWGRCAREVMGKGESILVGSLCVCVQMEGSDTGGIRSVQGATWDECVRRVGCFLGAHVIWGKYARSPWEMKA